MNENEFNSLADMALTRIETACDNAGVDVNRSGNVLEIEFDNGTKIIVNRHDINQEIWVAAPSGGFHYAYLNGAWTSHRDDSELYAKLAELFTEQNETFQP
ncbi:MAG: iron donor protein CyaY [Gallionellaceae bacterium CG1_02_56_997]|nr:MAG: iron donor protein CyaY [Gallionellaceae bacterium CG1_02_56_997]PIV15587.1 MAG: iron donor protein CyaY [Gallionellales bacterium CG03_land_8_20_14_0_80_55_15]HCJ50974.1 iron donor protein CyaY [Gallionella sp.]